MITRYAAVEYRAAVDIEPHRVEGVIMAYGDVAGPGVERFARGSIDLSGGVDLYMGHKTPHLLARHPGGGMSVTDDGSAVRLSAELPDTSAGRDAVELLRRGTLTGLSVEFVPRRSHFEGGTRVIDRALVPRVALVSAPAYPGSRVELRQAEHLGRRRLWL